MRSKTRCWPCAASSTTCQWYSTYTSLPGALPTSDGVPGTVPGAQPSRYQALQGPNQWGLPDQKTIAIDVDLRVRRPDGFRGEATEGVFGLCAYKFFNRDVCNVAFLGSYRERVTTVRTVLGQVPGHFFQHGIAALIVLDRKTRELIIDRFGFSSIGTQARYAVRGLVLDAWGVLYPVVVFPQAQAPASEPTRTVR